VSQRATPYQCYTMYALLVCAFKDGHSFKIKKLHFHLYFLAIQYLWTYALVEDIDN